MKLANFISTMALLAASVAAAPGVGDGRGGTNGDHHGDVDHHSGDGGHGHNSDDGHDYNGDGNHGHNGDDGHGHNGDDGHGHHGDGSHDHNGDGSHGHNGDDGHGHNGGSGGHHTGGRVVPLGGWTKKPCSGGQYYKGFYGGGCSCPNGYDYRRGKCVGYHKKPRPSHHDRQQCYCAKSASNYKPWNDNDDYCDEYDTQTFCCDKKDFFRKIAEYCPPHPTCGDGQKWSWERKRCVCPGSMISWKGSCAYPPMPRKSCGRDQACFCAKDPDSIVAYNKDHSYCGDDGGNTVFCSLPGPGEPEKYCRKNWH